MTLAEEAQHMSWSAALGLAGFTIWLLSFPMEGFLLARGSGPTLLLYFLVPHTSSLFLAGFLPRRTFDLVARLLGIFPAGASCLYLIFPEWGPWLLVAVGISAAPVLLRAGLLLNGTPVPSLTAGLGVLLANAGLGVLTSLPLLGSLKMLLVAAALLVPTLARTSSHPREIAATTQPQLWRRLPFIFVFSLVSGIFYGSLIPAYERVRVLPAVELLFYVIGVVAALFALSRRKAPILVCAVLLSMVSLLLFHSPKPFPIHLSMFSMQAAGAFMDMFILITLLEQEDPLRSFSTGFGTVCSGILAGKALSLLFGAYTTAISFSGSMALNLALLTLYVFPRKEPTSLQPNLPQARELPPGLHGLLSAMERSVLILILEGQTFREAAAALSISESSVKTYMKRIYDKLGVEGKSGLFQKLSPFKPPHPEARGGDPS